jgi:hypothetical protein
MKITVEEILQPLVALPLWSIGRAGSLEWFAFGEERNEIMLRDGSTKVVSEYALHVQCAWRIRHNSKTIVGSADRLYPSGEDPYQDILKFDWDQQNANQLDQRISMFLDSQDKSLLIVSSVTADESGDITVSLNKEYFLDVFPNNSIVAEHWRFFRPYSEDEHFVFTNEGIKRE